jgi:hypothetical protein
VATFLREPWWISIEIMFDFGLEKLTLMWPRFLVSLPVLECQTRLLAPAPSAFRGWVCVPRGPSTVTFRALMLTLTVQERVQLAFVQFLEVPCAGVSSPASHEVRCSVRPVMPKSNTVSVEYLAYLLPEHPASPRNECTSSWRCCSRRCCVELVVNAVANTGLEIISLCGGKRLGLRDNQKASARV